MSTNNRYREIDELKAIGIFFIILVHSIQQTAQTTLSTSIANISQFAVPVFVFCSCLLYAKISSKYTSSTPVYVARRVWRLLKPYYIFLIFYLPLTGVLTLKSIDIKHAISLLLVWAPTNEPDWAVLLFIYISCLALLVRYLYHRARPVFWLYVAAAVASAGFLLQHTYPFGFRSIMWLPWSLVVIFGFFVKKYEDRRWLYLVILIVPAVVFYTSYFILNQAGQPLNFYANKYPPNLYFLSYGILASSIFYIASRVGFFSIIPRQIVAFFSINSYSIYFVHFILILLFVKYGNIKIFSWWQFFFIIITLSVCTQLAMNKAMKAFSSSSRY